MRNSTFCKVSIVIVIALYTIFIISQFIYITGGTSTAGACADQTELIIKPHQKKNTIIKYTPAPLEQYFMDNMVTLGYDNEANPKTCNVWTDPKATNPHVYNMLQTYISELAQYNKSISDFEGIPNILKTIKENNQNQNDVCKKLRLHPDGLQRLFPSSQLSYSQSGYIEPLTPPMRSHQFCLEEMPRDYLMTIDYLVHDFEAMCQMLKPTSRIILIDMGASLDYHVNHNLGVYEPMIELMNLYEKFGFQFEHIYAFEVTPTEPDHVYQILPEKYIPSYHWINVGVSKEKGHKINPLHSLLKTFDEDDLVLVKLDIDTPSIEVPLAKQILEDEDGIYSKIVDQFYFEHHVHLGDLAPFWNETMIGSIKDSFELFHGLRKKGIPAHFWP